MSDQSKVAGSSAAPGLPVAHCSFLQDKYAAECIKIIGKAAYELEKTGGGRVECSTVVLVDGGSSYTSFTLVCKVSSGELLRLLEGRKPK